MHTPKAVLHTESECGPGMRKMDLSPLRPLQRVWAFRVGIKNVTAIALQASHYGSAVNLRLSLFSRTASGHGWPLRTGPLLTVTPPTCGFLPRT